MALKVWLPLNGTLENKGISEQTAAITSTPNWVNSGKIGGKALHTNTRQTTMYFPQLVGVKNYSVAYWLYIPSNETFTKYVDMFGIQFNCANNTAYERDERRASTSVGTHKYHLAKDGSAGSNTNTYWGIGPDRTDAKDVWSHFVMVKDDVSARFYANGVLVETVANSNFENTPRTMTGYMYLGDTNCAAYLNDFRIYDHCLSPKEVKEISQGLVLHYKLDGWSGGSGENLTLNSKTFNGWSIGSGWVKGEEDGYTTYNFSRTGATANNWVRIIPTLKINPNDYPNGITVSMDIKPVDISVINQTCLMSLQIYKADGTRVGWNEPQRGTGGMINNQWTRISYTFNQNALKTISTSGYTTADISYTQFSFQLVQNGNITIRKIKIEDGAIATPYSEAREDLGITKIKDSSGYENDGIVTGTLIVQNDSSRYNYSCYFNGSSCINYGTNPTFLKDKITVATWAKANNWTNDNNTRIISCTDSGGWQLSLNNEAGYFSWYIYANSAYKIVRYSVSNLNTGWHYFVGTYDGNITKLYIDGKLVDSLTVGNYPITYNASTILVIGNEPDGTALNSSCYWKGNLSDIRIYATALSAEDILDLYHTPANTDNLGNLHTFELNEISQNLITITGLEQGGMADANGQNADNPNRIRTYYIPVLPNQTYKISVSSGHNVRGIHYYKNDTTWISWEWKGVQSATFTTPANCYYIRIPFQNTDETTALPLSTAAALNPTLSSITERSGLNINETTSIKINKNGLFDSNHFSENGLNVSKIGKNGITQVSTLIEK